MRKSRRFSSANANTYFIDSEFWDAELEAIQYQRKTGISLVHVKRYKHAYMGVYEPKSNRYEWMSIEEFQGWFRQKTLTLKKMTLYSFYVYAELQFFPEDFLRKCLEDEEHCYQIGNSVYINIKYNNCQVEIKDIQKLTNAPNLQSLVEKFASDDLERLSRELGLDWHEIKKQRDDMSKLDIDTIKKYNCLDCMLSYVALKRFSEYLNKMLKAKHSLFDCITLGHWIYLWIKGFGYELLEDEYKYVEKPHLMKNDKVYTFLQTWLPALREAYYGGGIITTLAYQPAIYSNVTMIDAKSLYPISLLRVLRILPSSYADIYVTTDPNMLNKVLEDDNLYCIAKCTIRIKDGYDNVIGYRFRVKNKALSAEGADDEEDQYLTLYSKEVNSRFYCKDELKVLRQFADITSVDLILYWQTSAVTYVELYEKIRQILIERFTSDNETKKYVLKILLNSLYGKFAQKRLNAIKSSMVAGLITGVSRAIMLNAYYHLKEQGCKSLHFATDSIMLQGKYDDEILKQVNNWIDGWAGLREYVNGSYFNLEISDAILYLIRNKVYMLKLDDQLKKEAHHGIHISRGLVEQLLSKVMQNSNEIYYWIRDTYLKLDECRHLYDERVLFKNIVELKCFRYRADTKNQYKKNKVIPFRTTHEALNFAIRAIRKHNNMMNKVRKELKERIEIVALRENQLYIARRD